MFKTIYAIYIYIYIYVCVNTKGVSICPSQTLICKDMLFKHGKYGNILFGMIGYYIGYNIPPVIKIPHDV